MSEERRDVEASSSDRVLSPAEQRRQRRREKILSSGEDRLSQITQLLHRPAPSLPLPTHAGLAAVESPVPPLAHSASGPSHPTGKDEKASATSDLGPMAQDGHLDGPMTGPPPLQPRQRPASASTDDLMEPEWLHNIDQRVQAESMLQATLLADTVSNAWRSWTLFCVASLRQTGSMMLWSAVCAMLLVVSVSRDGVWLPQSTHGSTGGTMLDRLYNSVMDTWSVAWQLSSQRRLRSDTAAWLLQLMHSPQAQRDQAHSLTPLPLLSLFLTQQILMAGLGRSREGSTRLAWLGALVKDGAVFLVWLVLFLHLACLLLSWI